MWCYVTDGNTEGYIVAGLFLNRNISWGYWNIQSTVDEEEGAMERTLDDG